MILVYIATGPEVIPPRFGLCSLDGVWHYPKRRMGMYWVTDRLWQAGSWVSEVSIIIAYRPQGNLDNTHSLLGGLRRNPEAPLV